MKSPIEQTTIFHYLVVWEHELPSHFWLVIISWSNINVAHTVQRKSVSNPAFETSLRPKTENMCPKQVCTVSETKTSTFEVCSGAYSCVRVEDCASCEIRVARDKFVSRKTSPRHTSLCMEIGVSRDFPGAGKKISEIFSQRGFSERKKSLRRLEWYPQPKIAGDQELCVREIFSVISAAIFSATSKIFSASEKFSDVCIFSAISVAILDRDLLCDLKNLLSRLKKSQATVRRTGTDKK